MDSAVLQSAGWATNHTRCQCGQQGCGWALGQTAGERPPASLPQGFVPVSGLSPGWWWLTQSTATHSCSTCLGGTAAANLIREKCQFYSQQSRHPGMGHTLSQPQLYSSIWSLRNYCKRSKALRKAGLRGFFQVISSEAFFVSKESDSALLLSEWHGQIRLWGGGGALEGTALSVAGHQEVHTWELHPVPQLPWGNQCYFPITLLPPWQGKQGGKKGWRGLNLSLPFVSSFRTSKSFHATPKLGKQMCRTETCIENELHPEVGAGKGNGEKG